MPSIPVVIPRINANEDRVLVVKICVREGDTMAAAATLAVVETTKATFEIPAPCSGIVRGMEAVEGKELPVGGTLCSIVTEERTEALHAHPAPLPARGMETSLAPAPMPAAERHVTAKARLRAAELGVDVERVPDVAGRVGVAEVEAYGNTVRPAPAGKIVAAGPLRTVIVGGGRHAACVIDAAVGASLELIGCVDSVKPAGHAVAGGLKILGPIEMLETLRGEGVQAALIGVGGADDNRPRCRLFEKTVQLGFQLPPLIHPSAYVARAVPLGPGSIVLAKASIGPECWIGANVIVNQGSIVCHHSIVEDHAHITPGGILAGGCRIGRGATIGMGAAVYMNVAVGAWALVYNGVSVVMDVPAHAVVKRTTH